MKNIWEGIYNSFKECPKAGKGFESETWISQSLTRLKKLLDMTQENKTIPKVVSYNTSLLPFLTSLVIEMTEKKKVNILDLGGGLGFTYIPVIYACEEQQYIDYHIVESKSICEVGRDFFKDDERIHFHTSLPQEPKTMNIIHFGSSLQYIEDWRGYINALVKYNPLYFLFTDLIAGDIPTYVSLQNYYESKIPYRFYNIKEIIEHFSSIHFRLLFKSIYKNTYLGKEQELPQENFPDEFRLENSCSLLFCKE